ncbi:MAG: hypothetical protein ACE5KX_02850 [Acidimicrobiia bacterium]
MRRRTLVIAGLGAVMGAGLGLALLVLGTPRFIEHGVDGVLLDARTSRGRAFFEVTEGAFNAFVVLASAVGGLVLAGLSYVVGREAGPEIPRFRALPLLVLGTAAGVVIGYAAARSGIGVGGTIEEGILTLSVFRAVVIAAIAGATVGTIVGATVEQLSRPEVLGLEGEAWPRSSLQFLREAAVAMLIPILTIAVMGGIIFGFSRILLAGSSAVAVATAAAVAALILGGATLVANLPAPRREASREPSGE